MKDYTRWGSGIANVIIIPHQNVDRWSVNIDGDGSHYMDTFTTEHGARCWAIDVLVAYFGWSTGLAMETVEDCIRTRTWRATDPRFMMTQSGDPDIKQSSYPRFGDDKIEDEQAAINERRTYGEHGW